MNAPTWLKTEVEYGRDLVLSGIEGARCARQQSRTPADLLLDRARHAVPWALMGVSLGLLAAHWERKRNPEHSPAVFALCGGLIGLGTSFAVGTRQLASDALRGAMHNINRVRDAHWLAEHPIDYA